MLRRTDTRMDEATKRLKAERNAIWEQMRAHLDTAAKESRSMTAEEAQSFARAEVDFNAKTQEIEARERAVGIAAALAAPAPTIGVPSGDPVAERSETERRYDGAFSAYMKRGGRLSEEHRAQLDRGFVQMESRDMGEATGAAGGYLVPPGFLNKMTEVLKYFGGVRKLENQISTATGQSLIWPSNDDTGNPAVIIGENTTVSELDLTLGQRTLGAKMWTTGAVRIGRALVQDSVFDLESVVANRFAKRFGRGQNTAYTTGAGISGGLVAAASGLTLTAVAAPWVTFGQLLAMTHSIDPAYREGGNCAWLMSDSFLSAVQGIVDSQGRPLFIPAGSFGTIQSLGGPNGNSPSAFGDTLLGYPIVIDNDLAAPLASGSGVPCLFGDFNAGYIIRDVIGSTAVLRLDERYADTGEIGFIGYSRSDGNLDDLNAIRAITNHV
jgi:HK97 family phage major capsid protein